MPVLRLMRGVKLGHAFRRSIVYDLIQRKKYEKLEPPHVGSYMRLLKLPRMR
jgi:hypothetical protein